MVLKNISFSKNFLSLAQTQIGVKSVDAYAVDSRTKNSTLIGRYLPEFYLTIPLADKQSATA